MLTQIRIWTYGRLRERFVERCRKGADSCRNSRPTRSADRRRHGMRETSVGIKEGQSGLPLHTTRACGRRAEPCWLWPAALSHNRNKCGEPSATSTCRKIPLPSCRSKAKNTCYVASGNSARRGGTSCGRGWRCGLWKAVVL